MLENIDYDYLCMVIGNLTGNPIRVFYKGKQTFYHSIVNLRQTHWRHSETKCLP